MKRTIALCLCLAFAASVVYAFPPGMPPKENPLVTQVAPEDVGGFFSWQGTAPADSASNNKVEQALSRPEIKDALKNLQASFLEVFNDNIVAKKCIELALNNGACILGDTKDSYAGLISLGANGSDLIEEMTAEMKKAAASGEIKASTVSLGKMTFNKNTDSSGKDFYWGTLGKGKVLVFASSEKGLVELLKNARTPEPKWIATVKKDFGIERLSTLSGFSGEFIKKFAPEDEASDETDSSMTEFQKEFLGGEYIDSVVAASGLDNVGSVHKTAIYMKDGWKKTLPGIMIDKPLTDKDLSVIPDNAVFALAGKTDLNGLFKAATQAEGLPEEAKMQMVIVSAVITPYLSSLGDSWAFFVTDKGDVSGGALVWSLKNPAMAKIQLKQLMEMLKKNMESAETDNDPFGKSELGLNNVIPTQLFDDEEEEEDDSMPDMKIQVMPGGQIPGGAIPLGGGAVPLPGMMLLPQSVEKVKIGDNDFWLLNMGDDAPNFVIGIVGKNLVVTHKPYAEKYVKFNGAKNLGSNKAVAKMMANNPSYLIYADSNRLVSFANTATQTAGASQPGNVMTELITSSNLPIVVGVYSTDNAIRIDANSGLPLPDMILSLGVLGASSPKNE